MEWPSAGASPIRWDSAGNSPAGTADVELAVDSPAHLRHLIARARVDRHVVAFPYRQVSELVGDEPDHCRAGHGYAEG
ncbi:hypothetical protein ABZ541_04860 [Micromonospora sediminicola]|uniref:hypothetical protein n=1 Tax=Micromonospora sediminicola TaxID=946078 RepID=UPI0033FCA601